MREPPDLLLLGLDQVSARFGVLSARKTVADGPDTAADPGAGFHDRHVRAAGFERTRRRQAGESRTSHDHRGACQIGHSSLRFRRMRVICSPDPELKDIRTHHKMDKPRHSTDPHGLFRVPSVAFRWSGYDAGAGFTDIARSARLSVGCRTRRAARART